jgi:hypothetical protein
MGRREDLLRSEERGWQELNAVLHGLTDEQLETPGLTPDWSIKDLMWHVARWSADCVHALEQMRAGTFTGATIAEETESVNRRWLEESRREDLETVKAEWFSARTMMVETLASLDPLMPEAEEWFEEAGPLHYAEHLDDLRTWVASLA